MIKFIGIEDKKDISPGIAQSPRILMEDKELAVAEFVVVVVVATVVEDKMVVDNNLEEVGTNKSPNRPQASRKGQPKSLFGLTLRSLAQTCSHKICSCRAQF